MDRLAFLYGIPSTALRRSAQQGNYNETYEFTVDEVSCILRVSPDYHDAKSLERNMNYLGEHNHLGSPVVEPVASISGLLVETLHEGEGSARLVTATVKAPGTTHELLADTTISRDLYRRIGEAAARMHNNSEAMGTVAWDFPAWYESDNCFHAAEIPANVDGRIAAMYMEIWQRYRAQMAAAISLPGADELDGACPTTAWGVMHGDLHFSNILIDSQSKRITFCDFDDACLGFYAMDVAMIVFDLKVILQCSDKKRVFEQIVVEIIDGYNSVRRGQRKPLTALDLVDFLKLLELSMFIQCWSMYEQARDDAEELTGWLGLFYAGREQRILAATPYLAD